MNDMTDLKGNRTLVLIDSGQVREPADYALRSLLEFAGAQPEPREYSVDMDGIPVEASHFSAVISYGRRPPVIDGAAHLHIDACGLFEPNAYLKRAWAPRTRFDYEGISSLFPPHPGVPFLSRNGPHSATLGSDLAASTFVYLSGYEDIVTSGSIDKRGRRIAAESFQIRLDLIDRPVVNEYAAFLSDALGDLSAGRFTPVKRRWNGSEYALAITRDIDSIRKFPSLSLRQWAYLAARGDLKRAAASLRQRAAGLLGRGRDPHDNIEDIRKWEDGLGIRSSLYFMGSNLTGDANYQMSDLPADWDPVELQRSGWEIGFHPGYRAYSSGEAFGEERARLLRAAPDGIQGGRQHGLRFIPPFTWRHWEDHGFRYDCTVGFPEREGFKCGVCVPFRPFDILENRVLDVWEIPLTLMDCTLDSYRGMQPQQARMVMNGLLNQVKKHRGVFMLLWHNNYFGRENVGKLHDELAGLVKTAVDDGAMVGPAVSTLDAYEEWLTDLTRSSTSLIPGDRAEARQL